MKKYINPEIELELFSAEQILTASGGKNTLEGWAGSNTDNKIVQISTSNLKEVAESIEFTF